MGWARNHHVAAFPLLRWVSFRRVLLNVYASLAKTLVGDRGLLSIAGLRRRAAQPPVYARMPLVLLRWNCERPYSQRLTLAQDEDRGSRATGVSAFATLGGSERELIVRRCAEVV